MSRPRSLDDPSTGLRIIPARFPEHLIPVRELFAEYAALLRSNHEEVCVRDIEREIAELPGIYAPPGGRLLLAYHGDRLAGCVALRPHAPGIGEMKHLYVRPEFRGQKVGRGLAVAIIEEARQIGYDHLRLDTLPSMAEAVRLYQSLGFTNRARYGPSPAPGAIFLELVLA